MRQRSDLRPAQLRVVEELNGVSVETLRNLIHYDSESGQMVWRPRSDNLSFTTRWAGKRVFTSDNGKGYKTALVMGRRLTAHRVAYAIFYGRAPRGEIDHINGVREDNRIQNLRDVPAAINRRNSARSSRNVSGVTGVSWKKAYSKWQACFQVDGKQIHLGYFSRKEDAIQTLLRERAKYGYHDNHGRGPNAKT